MAKGLEALLRNIFGEPKKTVVCKLSENLLEKWRKHALAGTVLKMERKIHAESFTLEYLQREGMPSWNPAKLTDLATKTYETEKALALKTFDACDKVLKEQESALWDQTYIIMGLNRANEYVVDIETGDVQQFGEVTADA